MKTGILITFLIYFIFIIGIGFYFYKKLNNIKEYFLGGRSLNSWVTAMSAQASDMSGWLLMGLPAAIYIGGMSSAWIAIGLAIGTYLNWKIIAKRLRKFSSASNDSITIPQYLQNRFLTDSHILRILCSVVIFIFFLIYTASAFSAAAKLFHYVFNIDYTLALSIGAGVILLYTYLGGFLAACWTDLFQGFLMLFALMIVPIITYFAIPNVTFEMFTSVNNGTFLNLFHTETSTISLKNIISNLSWGLGYLGMPHILIRFMAIKSDDMIKKARNIAIVWVILTLSSAVAIGIIGKIYLASKGIIYSGQSQAEVIFMDIIHNVISSEYLIGILLAAILAAIMSTGASQLLVTASTISNDFYKLLIKPTADSKELLYVSRNAVLLVVILAYSIALNPQSSVMNLVSYAWAGFGSAFGPIILLSLFWKRLTLNGTIAGIITGSLTVLCWENISILQSTDIYSILPGFILSLFVTILVSLLDKEPPKKVEELFCKQDIKKLGC